MVADEKRRTDARAPRTHGSGTVRFLLFDSHGMPTSQLRDDASQLGEETSQLGEDTRQLAKMR